MSAISRRRQPRHAAHAAPEASRPRRGLRRTALLAAPAAEERTIVDDLAELDAQDALAPQPEAERRDADAPDLTYQFPAVPGDAPEAAQEDGSCPYPPSDPREELARVLADPETATVVQMQRLLDSMRKWEPTVQELEAARPFAPRNVPQPLAPPLPQASPDGATLVSFQPPEKAVLAYLDGMPQRTVTDTGKPVLMLGLWLARNGASFAIADMSDEWLGALVYAAQEELDMRRAERTERVPSFAPHIAHEAGSWTGEAYLEAIADGAS